MAALFTLNPYQAALLKKMLLLANPLHQQTVMALLQRLLLLLPVLIWEQIIQVDIGWALGVTIKHYKQN
jgi:hypothetical protein